jgi:hypothetical protein
MYIDFLKDYGLDLNVKGNSFQNIVIEYLIDSTSAPIQKGNVVSYINNNIRKMQSADYPRAIALEDGIAGDSIKCQITGIVKINDYFIAGSNYFNTVTGELTYSPTTGTTVKSIGIAITKDELLIRRGAFTYAI